MCFKLKGLLFTLVALTILGGRVASTATIKQFTDRNAFNAGTMNRALINFEGLAPPGGFTFYGSPGSLMLSGVTFASNGPLFVQNSNGGPLGVGSRLTFQQATPRNILNVTLPASVSAVGFNFIAGDPVTITLSIGQSSQSFNIGTSPFPNFSFIGFTADEPIRAIQVVSVSGADLDNFTFGVKQVPVILVHGFLGRPSSFGNMKSLLVNDAGHRAGDMYEYDYNFLTSCSSASNTPIELIAADFARFLKAKLNIYPPGTQVDVVAHSMGGLVVRAYMVGMAPAPNGLLLPYGNEIRRLIMAGTPNYGADLADWNTLIRVACRVAERPGGLASQAEEMKYGARFLWDLDRKWIDKDPIEPGDLLVIAGTASGVSDGIVRTVSAALPEDFSLPAENILYVPYRHCDVIICGTEQYKPLVYIQDTSHLTYRIVKEFLRSGQPPTQAGLGYQPSNPVLNESLLLLRMVDKVTETPIVPPPPVTIRMSCPVVVGSPTIILNKDPDAGTVTVVGIPASLWSCSAVEIQSSPYYFEASINDITILPGLPHVRAIELTRRPDVTR